MKHLRISAALGTIRETDCALFLVFGLLARGIDFLNNFRGERCGVAFSG